jgi:hypothetical protein
VVRSCSLDQISVQSQSGEALAVSELDIWPGKGGLFVDLAVKCDDARVREIRASAAIHLSLEWPGSGEGARAGYRVNAAFERGEKGEWLVSQRIKPTIKRLESPGG